MSARIVQSLSEIVGGPLFRRIVAQGMRGDDVTSLTMPEIKGGIICSTWWALSPEAQDADQWAARCRFRYPDRKKSHRRAQSLF